MVNAHTQVDNITRKASVQCGGAILVLVLHATVTGASRYAALGSVRWLLVLHRMFLRVSSFQRVSLWPVRA